jgi:hypothetical protein
VSEVALYSVLSAVFANVSAALGTTVPLGSLTVPEILPPALVQQMVAKTNVGARTRMAERVRVDAHRLSGVLARVRKGPERGVRGNVISAIVLSKSPPVAPLRSDEVADAGSFKTQAKHKAKWITHL